MNISIGDRPIRSTRYPELGYRQDGRDWNLYAMPARSHVGPHYASRSELLADLHRYAAFYGCEA